MRAGYFGQTTNVNTCAESAHVLTFVVCPRLAAFAMEQVVRRDGVEILERCSLPAGALRKMGRLQWVADGAIPRYTLQSKKPEATQRRPTRRDLALTGLAGKKRWTISRRR